MTYVEFFEKDAVENICSCLAKIPDRVILIGEKKKVMDQHAARYKSILAARGHDVDISSQTVNKNDLQTITGAFSKIIETYGDCVFDLTGGDELYLVAAGIVFEKYKDKNIQMHRFNIKNNTIIDCDQDGNTILTEKAPELSVEENIRIYGGDIVYDTCKKGRTFRWDLSEDFKSDINAMWDVCRKDIRLWNTQLFVFEAADRLTGSTDELTVSLTTKELEKELTNRDCKCVFFQRIIGDLYGSGLIRDYYFGKEEFSITYKNKQVKYCLSTPGKALEMKVLLAAEEAKGKDGTKVYNDVMNGVCIDWDGDVHPDRYSYDTENEIDAILMHGMVPVFVSCKGGYFDNEELYKLNSVAMRFGGKYAKKVLIAASLDKSDYSEHLRTRAADMGINLIEGSFNGEKKFCELNDEEMNKIFRTLWSL